MRHVNPSAFNNIQVPFINRKPPNAKSPINLHIPRTITLAGSP